MKIWIVEDGCYSDFHIEGAFSTPEKAQEYITAVCPSGNVVEYSLDQYDREISLHQRGYHGWTVIAHRFGKHKGKVAAQEAHIPRPNDWDSRIQFYPYEPTYMEIYVIAKTKAGAVKIAREKERQAIAEGWWGFKGDVLGYKWEPTQELGE